MSQAHKLLENIGWKKIKHLFIGSFVAEAEAPILWPLDAKSQLIEKDPDAGKDWRQKEKGVAGDEMIRKHHWLNGHELRQTPEIVEEREAWFATVHGVAELDTT